MKILKEFKEFAVKGNVIDLAVGVIIGGAFGKIVSSLVSDIIMPPIGAIIRGIDFKNLKLVMSRTPQGEPLATWNYGNFIQNIIEFFIIAFAVFMLVKAINRFKRKREKAPAPTQSSRQEVLLEEIRDILKRK